MPIRVSCDCGRATTVKDELAGRKVRCPGCQAVLDVPDAEGLLDVEPEPEERPTDRRNRPRSGQRESEDERPRRRRDEEDEPEARDRRPARRKVRRRAVRAEQGGMAARDVVFGSLFIGLGLVMVCGGLLSALEGRLIGIPVFGVALIVGGVFYFVKG